LRNIAVIVALALLGGAVRCWPQEKVPLNIYFRDYVGLTDGQIKAIRSGKAIAKTLHSRTPAEIFVFGAVYIKTKPEAYIEFSADFDRLRAISGYLAVGRFSTPPQFADLNGFTFDGDDINSLKTCTPGDCQIQMPESSMEDIRQSIDWSAPNVAEQVNQLAQQTALERLNAYQQNGNIALGTYDDKQHPADVAGRFQNILSHSRVLPEHLPTFYNYLLSYPRQRPANVDDTFYWAKVNFGLKPTLRIVHVVTMRGDTGGNPAFAIAEKQLYASHYFQTALDLTFCIPHTSDPQRRGFYLIKVMGSEQAGLTGFKGAIIRKVAVDRSASTLQKSLTAIKNALEHGR
jgi:hypothetical protein